MGNKRRISLALVIVAVLVGMHFASIPIGACDNNIVPPTVTKSVCPTDLYFGHFETMSTVTIEVTGAGDEDEITTPIDVVFAIDSSGSMQTNDPDNDRLLAAKTFLGELSESRDQAGVVSWDEDVDFAEGLSSDFGDTSPGIGYHIDQVDSSGLTNPDAGLAAAVTMLDDDAQSGSIRIIIFLTDGYPVGGSYTYYGDGGPVDTAATAGYIIFGIGLGESHSSAILEDMTAATGGVYYDSPDPDNLLDIYDDIKETIIISTIPHYVKVKEVLEDYIVLDEDSFNIEPDSITYNGDGTTTIIWLDVGQHVGNYDSALTADETVTLTFDIGADKPGMGLKVQEQCEAWVYYKDNEGASAGKVKIPQAYINVYQTVKLIAGGGNPKSAIDVGYITLTNDQDYLYVTYVTTDGWYITEAHLHVTDADDTTDVFPLTKKDNPKVGQFEYSAEDLNTQEHTFEVPWTFGSGATLDIAAHAVVQKEVGEILIECVPTPVYQVETAWGEGDTFNDKNWAMHFLYEDP
jgi:Ca-activated chloride channel family protein